MNKITGQEFIRFLNFITRSAEGSHSASKKVLVRGRLATRVQHRWVDDTTDSLCLPEKGDVPHEVQTAVDSLTTNDASFFRGAGHFYFLSSCSMAARIDFHNETQRAVMRYRRPTS